MIYASFPITPAYADHFVIYIKDYYLYFTDARYKNLVCDGYHSQLGFSSAGSIVHDSVRRKDHNDLRGIAGNKTTRRPCGCIRNPTTRIQSLFFGFPDTQN